MQTLRYLHFRSSLTSAKKITLYLKHYVAISDLFYCNAVRHIELTVHEGK